VDLVFYQNPPPLLPVSGSCMPVSHSIIFRSSSTSSVHLFRGLRLFLITSILAVTIYVAILSLSILSVCPYLSYDQYYKLYNIYPLQYILHLVICSYFA
jgi:hypothetical protein